VRGISIEVLAFVLLTALLPVAFVIGFVVDAVLWLQRRKPFMAVRLVAMAWWFLLNELHGMLSLLWIWASNAGDTPRRRRGVYDLRIRWARMHLAGIRVLFGLKFEIEGLEEAGPGPVTILIRHASIIDNMLPDAVVAHRHGLGLRYVIKRELQMIPTIDLGGRWVPTNFVRRASGDVEAELARLRLLAEDLDRGEGLLIYPEGTRHTDAKLARAQEIIRERNPEIAPLADRLRNVLPPRLGGPPALLDAARHADVVLFGHVGLDGFEYISDIWGGGLIGTPVKMKFWRFPAGDIPEDETELIEWLYGVWQILDDWVGEQLGRQAAAVSSASAASLRT
jgi:1-acyl-sn-glycerol-3-phosphate acyltransferase